MLSVYHKGKDQRELIDHLEQIPKDISLYKQYLFNKYGSGLYEIFWYDKKKKAPALKLKFVMSDFEVNQGRNEKGLPSVNFYERKSEEKEGSTNMDISKELLDLMTEKLLIKIESKADILALKIDSLENKIDFAIDSLNSGSDESGGLGGKISEMIMSEMGKEKVSVKKEA